jgi:sec-independent protein translocase protein TatB
MFDIGLSKMALIGAVALVVIGPEAAARGHMVGTLLGRAQRYVSDVKARSTAPWSSMSCAR